MRKIISQTWRNSRVFAVGTCLGLINDFRTILRDQTRADHDRLDRLVGSLDISQRSGFSAFAEMHLSCFLAMQSRQAEDSNSAQTRQWFWADLSDGQSSCRFNCQTSASRHAFIDPHQFINGTFHVFSGYTSGAQILAPVTK